MELEDANPEIRFKPEVDRRPRVPEPLGVRLLAVNDMRVDSAAGLERKIDAFYVRVAARPGWPLDRELR